MGDKTVHGRHTSGKPASPGLGLLKEFLEELPLEECSIFGDRVKAVIVEVSKRTPGNKAEILHEFMRREVNERVRRSRTPEEGGKDWSDAMNLFDGVFMFTPETKIMSGTDVKIVRRSLAETKMQNIEERRKLAQVYFAARKEILPNAPFPR